MTTLSVIGQSPNDDELLKGHSPIGQKQVCFGEIPLCVIRGFLKHKIMVYFLLNSPWGDFSLFFFFWFYSDNIYNN